MNKIFRKSTFSFFSPTTYKNQKKYLRIIKMLDLCTIYFICILEFIVNLPFAKFHHKEKKNKTSVPIFG